MSPSRPYLIRALYEWIIDNGQTPYILVNAEDESVVVPQQFVENGKIVLNITPSAVQNLQLGNQFVELDARFSGSPMHVSVPVMSVLAIYARENGKGMVFTDEDGGGMGHPPGARPRTTKASVHNFAWLNKSTRKITRVLGVVNAVNRIALMVDLL